MAKKVWKRIPHLSNAARDTKEDKFNKVAKNYICPWLVV